eukprot:TRINITY_DN37405_c0_g1_i1.p1 TRINITY_DN37405_c0_g1~~TRINITY_DN37405_c0_g1_i1.p1  ORF type:complete len:712 (+),score=163.07 TRINITY_DN37405_c0_g1_i1:202-2337(+)
MAATGRGIAPPGLLATSATLATCSLGSATSTSASLSASASLATSVSLSTSTSLAMAVAVPTPARSQESPGPGGAKVKDVDLRVRGTTRMAVRGRRARAPDVEEAPAEKRARPPEPGAAAVGARAGAVAPASSPCSGYVAVGGAEALSSSAALHRASTCPELPMPSPSSSSGSVPFGPPERAATAPIEGSAAQAHLDAEVARWVRVAPPSAHANFSSGPEAICHRLLRQPASKLKLVLQQCARRRANGDRDDEVLTWMEGFVVAVLAREFGVHVRMTLEGPVSTQALASARSSGASLPDAAPAAVPDALSTGASQVVGCPPGDAGGCVIDLEAEGSPNLPAALLRAPSWGLGAGGAPKQTLRISAGRAAAVAGIHPYADVGEVFLELLYQDLPELLLRDSALAGVEIVSADLERAQLMAKSGEAAALEEALRLGAAAEGLEGIREARRVVAERLAAAEAAGSLSAQESADLRNTLELELNLDFGARHEDAALEAYAARVGQPIYGEQHRVQVAMPCGGPEEALTTVFPAQGSGCRASIEAEAAERQRRRASHAEGRNDQATPEAYFKLTGFTDAIVDLPSGDNGQTETLVVEVKHRMGKIQDPPNIYDIVQLCSYCRVLGCARGDLVQCLRDDAPGSGTVSAERGLHVTRIDFSEGSPDRVGWDRHVLPGLYDFARAVYAARADQGVRLRLLAASAEERTTIVAELCPHLGK